MMIITQYHKFVFKNTSNQSSSNPASQLTNIPATPFVQEQQPPPLKRLFQNSRSTLSFISLLKSSRATSDPTVSIPRMLISQHTYLLLDTTCEFTLLFCSLITQYVTHHPLYPDCTFYHADKYHTYGLIINSNNIHSCMKMNTFIKVIQ